MRRLHVVTGLVLMLLAMPLAAAHYAPAGVGQNWYIENYFWGASENVKFSIVNCTISAPEFTLVPGGVVRAQATLCGDGLSLVVVPDNVKSAALLEFYDGVTKSSYWVPPLEKAKAFKPAAPIVVDPNRKTYLTVYSDEAQTLTWTVYEPDGTVAAQGDAQAAKGWSQTNIKIPTLSAGSIKVVAGCPSFGVCPAYPFAGFLAVTDTQGGNAAVVVLEPQP